VLFFFHITETKKYRAIAKDRTVSILEVGDYILPQDVLSLLLLIVSVVSRSSLSAYGPGPHHLPLNTDL
jgi:hypothetical protein